jgi:hypothetical protein
VVSAPDNPELQLSNAIFRLVKYFNLIEENVGLCISYLENPADPKATYGKLAKLSAERKIDWLRDLLGSCELISEQGVREFEKWCDLAAQARSIRNRYVHGHWVYLPLRSDKPVDFQAPAWMRDKPGHESKAMSFAELETVVDEMKGIFDEIKRIRDKYHI